MRSFQPSDTHAHSLRWDIRMSVAGRALLCLTPNFAQVSSPTYGFSQGAGDTYLDHHTYTASSLPTEQPSAPAFQFETRFYSEDGLELT